MNLWFLIIILSLIGLIINSDYEYNLTSGSSQYLGILEKSKSYKFYIPALYNHNLYIEFRKSDSTSTSSQSINIYEYSSRNSTLPIGWTSYNYLSYSSSTKTYSYLYLIKYPTCKYLSFEIKPLYVMVSTYVEAIYVYEYNLNIGSSLYFDELSTSYFYIFYVSVKYPQTINIEFSKTDSKSTSSQSIAITELSNRASSSKITWNSYDLIYNSLTNSYSFSYKIIYQNCKYLSFEILPNYKMSNVKVKVNNIPQVYDYDLTSNSEEYLSKLSDSIIYKFYIPAKYGQKVDFKLISFSSSLNFETIYIYEYSKRDSTSELSKRSIELSESSSNYYKYSYSYDVTDSSCNYVALEIKPNSDLPSAFIEATVESETSWALIILILIIIICIISLLIWYFIRKKKKQEISFENPSTQPLSPLQ